jgi:hypothetical protein
MENSGSFSPPPRHVTVAPGAAASIKSRGIAYSAHFTSICNRFPAWVDLDLEVRLPRADNPGRKVSL